MRNTYQGNAAEVNWPTEIARAHVLHFIVIFIIEIFGLIALNWLQQAQMSTCTALFSIEYYLRRIKCIDDTVSLMNIHYILY